MDLSEEMCIPWREINNSIVYLPSWTPTVEERSTDWKPNKHDADSHSEPTTESKKWASGFGRVQKPAFLKASSAYAHQRICNAGYDFVNIRAQIEKNTMTKRASRFGRVHKQPSTKHVPFVHISGFTTRATISSTSKRRCKKRLRKSERLAWAACPKM